MGHSQSHECGSHRAVPAAGGTVAGGATPAKDRMPLPWPMISSDNGAAATRASDSSDSSQGGMETFHHSLLVLQVGCSRNEINNFGNYCFYYFLITRPRIVHITIIIQFSFVHNLYSTYAFNCTSHCQNYSLLGHTVLPPEQSQFYKHQGFLAIL